MFNWFGSFINPYMANPFAQFFMPMTFGFNPFYQQTFQPVYTGQQPQPTYSQQPVSIFHSNDFGGNPDNIKGKTLFQNALAGVPSQSPNPPMCARYVKNAIVNSGLGEYVLGNGEETKYMLRNNLNFREVKVKGEDLKNLPVGTVITYDAFDSGIGEHGHVVVKGEGNMAISDRIENSIIPSDNAHVFMLV